MGGQSSAEREIIKEYRRANLEEMEKSKEIGEKLDEIDAEIKELERENKIKKESLSKEKK